MGKTVGSILRVAAVIAAVVVNVVPGVGQLASAAIVAGLTAASAIAFALAKSPKPEQASTALKSPVPARVSAYGRLRLFGAYILYETANDGRAVDVWAFHDGRIDAIEQFYVGDDKVTVNPTGWVGPGEGGRYGNYNRVFVKASLGAAIGPTWPDVIGALPGIWTDQHRGDGVAIGIMISNPVKSKNFSTIYSSGGPNATPLSLVMRAQCVFDWRDSAQQVGDPRTWSWTENAVLHLAHYLLVRKLASGSTRAASDPAYWSDIASSYSSVWSAKFAPALAFWTAAANDADVAMPLKGGGTEPRYRSCVAHKHTDEHKGVIANLLGCFDGWLSERSDGALVVYSGRYYAPTVSIDPSQIVSYSIQEGVEEESAVNELPLTYVSAAHDFATVDCTAWRDEDDIARRGKVLSSPLSNQVPSHAQARRLAKRAYAASAALKRGTFTTTPDGATVVGQRYIQLTIAEAGAVFFDGPVEITKIVRLMSTGGVSAEWIAADPDIDAWNPATEEGDPAGKGDRVALEPLATPTIASVTPTYSTSGVAEGSTDMPVTGVRLSIKGMGPERDDLTWFARWRETGTGPWIEREFTDTAAGAPVELLTDFVQVTGVLEVEIAYSLGDGRLSDWSAPYAVDSRVVDPRITESGDQRVTEDNQPRIGE